MTKAYVDVVAYFSKDGRLMPQTIIWEDGHRYDVDRILKIERCASRKAGGTGIRYTCRIEGKESHIYLEEDRWFVERKTD